MTSPTDREKQSQQSGSKSVYTNVQLWPVELKLFFYFLLSSTSLMIDDSKKANASPVEYTRSTPW